MIGAIIGDIVGSRFEWHNIKTKEFDLFNLDCEPTDDSIMTFAVANALLDCDDDYERLAAHARRRMVQWGRRYPFSGYGGRFGQWLYEENPLPYNSWGNGSAMRVSPCGFAAKTLEEAKALSYAVTAVTHNHPEGLKGAEATTVAIFLARMGSEIKDIRDHITNNYYKIDFTLDSIRDSYRFNESCQGTVPQALEAFFESTSYEDAIRNAVSIGGDSDTLAAITGGIAAAYYGVPDDVRNVAFNSFLDTDQQQMLTAFEQKFGSTSKG